jgi:hypothetical protein
VIQIAQVVTMNPRKANRYRLQFALFMLVLASSSACAQSLPKPSRTIFKCEVQGKITYSDEPCLGAKRLDAEPTRGADSYSGQRRLSEDVSLELRRESLAKALQPITGLNAQQFDALARRQGLDANGQRECRQLERDILQLESGSSADTALQSDLLARRKRYKQLRC